MEEATVSGLLSTLNEDAQEDILIEAINNARDSAFTYRYISVLFLIYLPLSNIFYPIYPFVIYGRKEIISFSV